MSQLREYCLVNLLFREQLVMAKQNWQNLVAQKELLFANLILFNFKLHRQLILLF